MLWLRSLLFTALLFGSTLVYAVVVLLTGFLPFHKRYEIARSWARFNLRSAKVLCGLDYVVEGMQNIPAGAHISMWKHSSAWETIAQMLIFPPQSWVLKRELMWIPVVGWATALMKPIAINRAAGHRAVNQVLELGAKRLQEGMWVLVFPEGTRVPAGETRKYGISGALLATRTGAMVVPVAHNAGDFWPRRGLRKRAGTIRVIIGPPIATAGRDPRAVNDEVQGWIENQLQEISVGYQTGASAD